MPSPIRLSISTCPNDTFAFHALMHGLVDTRGLKFEVELLDIQQLNDRALRQEADVLKVSFAAALEVADRYWVLPSGSALGFGAGPLLLAARPHTLPTNAAQLTLCPGRLTTASVLFQLFHPNTTRIDQVVFSDIMPRLRRREADFGVCIHEGRFVWQQQGLYLVEDLGTRWEEATGCPLPLGGILASRTLGQEVARRVQHMLFDSLQYARRKPEEALITMRQHAQEFDDTVLMQHVDLYVNDWTIELGSVGRKALNELYARTKSFIPGKATDRLEILQSDPVK